MKSKSELIYNLRAFFEGHNYLNISLVAKKAEAVPVFCVNILPVSKSFGLAGKKIEEAIHKIAGELSEVSICA